MTAPRLSPSQRLLDHLVDDLRVHLPFSAMAAADVREFAAAAAETYHAPGELVLAPEQGVVDRLLFVRRGAVVGRRNEAAHVHHERGDLFPIAALMSGRAVISRYEALDDLFCLEVEAAVVQRLAARSAVFAAFLQRRIAVLLDASRRALRESQAAELLAERSMEAPLSELPRKVPVSCAAETPLIDALKRMHEARVGSIVAVDADGRALGILTRHDLLERVLMARVPDTQPVIEVMSRPVATLPIDASVQGAALLMSRQGIRHLPLTEHGRVVSIVSERDLFALQRLSLRHLGPQIRAAGDLPALVAAGAQIRRFARHLMGQGLSSQSLTQLLSQLNDQLTSRVVTLVAARHGADLTRACWLAFGSEGRSEQTIATDQDNGLLFDSDHPDRDRPHWLAVGDEVNQWLAACGYPLCKGGVMAGNPACCLSGGEWADRFATWIGRGEPEDLLAASIFFDLRVLEGQGALAAPLQDQVVARAPGSARFLRLLAENALRRRPPLNWRGALDAQHQDGQRWIDLKLQGTAIFVDAARLFALVHGLRATGTRERLLAAAEPLRVPAEEASAWVSAFEYLQLFRLRLQAGQAAESEHPNRIELPTLDAIDQRILREAFRVARGLQERIELDLLR